MPSIRWRPNKAGTARRTDACASFVPTASSASRGVEQVRVHPGAILGLVCRHGAGQPGQHLAVRAGEGEGVNPRDDRVRSEVPVPVFPLLLQLDQAHEVFFDSGPLLHPPAQSRSQGKAADGKTGRGLGPEHLSVGKHDRCEALYGRSRGEEPRDEVLARTVGVTGRATAFAECSRLGLEIEHPAHDAQCPGLITLATQVQ